MFIGEFEKDSVGTFQPYRLLNADLNFYRVSSSSRVLQLPKLAVSLVLSNRAQSTFPCHFLHHLLLTSYFLSLMYFLPLGLLGAYFAWRYYSTGSA